MNPDPVIPTHCSAIRITAPGGPQVLQMRDGVALPELGDDELLIEVAFAGVNRHDCNQRRRGPTPAHSDTPGLEVSGIVRAAGRRVQAFKVGDAVCALVDGGGYATHVVAPAALAFPVMGALDMKAAAALPEAMFTTWHNFFGVASLGPGESVLVHGGTSGVGSFAVQLLSLLGHPVYATCGSEEKMAHAMRLGARAVFNYKTQDFAQEIRRETQGQGVDVILDVAAGEHLRSNLEALAWRGRIVHLSPGNDAVLEVPLRTLMAKEAKVTGSLLRPLPLALKALVAQRLRRVVMPLVYEGKVQVWVTQCLPLQRAAQAHELLESGASMGKTVLQAPGATGA